MTSLSPGVLFQTTGLNRSSTPIGFPSTPDEIKNIHTRQPVRHWPKDSPVAKVYDIGNSPSSLILLNNRFNKSRLRGQSSASSTSSNPDPDRHFRSKSQDSSKHVKCHDSSMPRYEPGPVTPLTCSWVNANTRPPVKFANGSHVNEWHHYDCQVSSDPRWKSLENSKPRRSRPKTVPASLRTNYYLQHPDFTQGQLRYMWDIARVYSTTNLKVLNQERYEVLIARERRRGFFTDDDYHKYMKYIKGGRKQQFSDVKTLTQTPRAKTANPTSQHSKHSSRASTPQQESRASTPQHENRQRTPRRSESSPRSSLSSTSSSKKASQISHEASTQKTAQKPVNKNSNEESRKSVDDEIPQTYEDGSENVPIVEQNKKPTKSASSDDSKDNNKLVRETGKGGKTSSDSNKLKTDVSNNEENPETQTSTGEQKSTGDNVQTATADTPINLVDNEDNKSSTPDNVQRDEKKKASGHGDPNNEMQADEPSKEGSSESGKADKRPGSGKSNASDLTRVTSRTPSPPSDVRHAEKSRTPSYSSLSSASSDESERLKTSKKRRSRKKKSKEDIKDDNNREGRTSSEFNGDKKKIHDPHCDSDSSHSEDLPKKLEEIEY